MFGNQLEKDIIKAAAKQSGISVREMRARIAEGIENLSSDPDTQEGFQQMFGNRKPTPEQYMKAYRKQAKKLKLRF